MNDLRAQQRRCTADGRARRAEDDPGMKAQGAVASVSGGGSSSIWTR